MKHYYYFQKISENTSANIAFIFSDVSVYCRRVLSVLFLYCSLLASPSIFASAYDVTTITPQPLSTTIKRTGTLEFKRTTKLSFNTSGFLQKLTVDEGSLINKNQLLAALDIVELAEQKNIAFARLKQAKSEVERASILLDKNMSSEQELEDKKTLVDTARADYKIAYYNLEKAEIRAPFDGVVISRFSDVGELQSPTVPLIEVAALENNLVVEVFLTGQEVSQIKLGQNIDVALPSSKVIIGKVSKIAVVAEQGSHLYAVEALLPALQFNNGAIAGQMVDVVITVIANKNAYKLPIEALVSMTEEGRAIIMVETSAEENLIEQHTFEVINLDNHYIYLSVEPSQSQAPLSVVTRGWQHLEFSTQPASQ